MKINKNNLILKIALLGFLMISGNISFASVNQKDFMPSSPAPVIVSATATPSTNSAVLNGTVNPNGANTTAWYESSETGTQKLGMINLGSGTSGIPMLPYTLNGLTPNTNYTFRVVAQNINGTTTGSWVPFTTTSGGPQSSKPTIVSATATPSTTSAVLNGTVNPNGANTTAWYESSQTGSQKLGFINLGSGTNGVPMLAYTLTGLTPNTNYTFRVVAQNINGTTNGSWVSFTTTGVTNNSKPTIVSQTATNITTTSAELNGEVNPNGDTTDAWFHLGGPLAAPLGFQSIGNGNLPVQLTPYSLTGLTPGTTYYFRVEASNSSGISRGHWVTFTTLGIVPAGLPPTIVSATATNITTTSADLNGEVNPNGDSTQAWFETPSFGPYQVQNIGNGTSPVQLTPYTLTGLAPNTIYTFRVVAKNINGITFGNWITYTTLSTTVAPPTLTSISPTSGTQGQNNLSVSLNGSGFIAGSTVVFSGSGIVINSTTVNNSNLITVDISINSNATIGGNNVYVTNANGISNTEIFTVVGATPNTPTLISISPSSGTQGQNNLSVALNGTGFIAGSSVVFSGSGIVINSTTVNSSTLITVDISINSNATVGGNNVYVTNVNGTSNTQIFTVINTSGGGGPLVPNISSISPSSAIVGSGSLIVTIYGSNFNNTTYALYNGMGRSVNFINGGQLSMTLNSSDLSYVGSGNITVSNGNGFSSNSITFFVNAINNGGGWNGNGGGNGGGGGAIYYVSVVTQNETGILDTSAILNGSINPNNNATTAWFEYGTSNSLATWTETSHIFFGAGGSYTNLSQGISNLNPNTTYYFRAVANNYAGTIKGNVFYFTTKDSTTNNNFIVRGSNLISRIFYQDSNSTTNDSSNNSSTFGSSPSTINTNYFDSNNLGAAALFGSTNIFPKTLFGWLIFLILILAVIIIARYIYIDYAEQKSLNKVSANHIENLPI